MTTIPELLRQRPLPRAVSEGALLALLAALAAVSAFLTRNEVGFTIGLASGLLPLLVLWRRRDAPVAVFLLVELLAGPSRVLSGANGPAELAVLVAIYTVASRRPMRVTVAVVVLDAVAMALLLAGGPQAAPWTVEVVGQVSTATVAALLGLYVRSRRATEQALRDRAERLERERELAAQAAVDEERRRIARELHDVVAHHVSVMTLHAGALERRLGASDADAASREAAAGIRTAGQQAMTELRRLLGLLHRDADEDENARAPQPDLRALDLLVQRVRETGMDASLSITGPADEVSAGMALAVYRIVQEALTNVLRHAGTVPVDVRVEVDDDEVVVQVRDHGPVSGSPPAYPGSLPDGPGTAGGRGLLHMRERAALFAGSVESGPVPDGGYEVAARLRRDHGPAARSMGD
ncbi:MAG: sensor histidine kinase [Nitriliruptoraceae bacterium]